MNKKRILLWFGCGKEVNIMNNAHVVHGYLKYVCLSCQSCESTGCRSQASIYAATELFSPF